MTDPRKTVEIRAAEAAEAEAVARIHRRARVEAMPWLPRVHTAEEELRFFANVVLPNQSVELALRGGVPVGFVAYDPRWIHHLYVLPDGWRRGIGTTLMARPMAAFRRLELWTFQANHAARHFYARLGFTEAEFTDGSRNEERMPDVRMTWHGN